MRALFVYSDQRSSSSSRTLSNEELSRFSRFFLLLWFSVKTKHAAYLVYAVRVTLEGEETDESKMPSLITGMTESASTWRHRPRLLFPSLSPSLLYNHLYHCIRPSSGKGLLQLPSCTLMWLKNWPLVPLFVCFGDRWIHLNKKNNKKKTDALVFALRFQGDVSVGDTARPRSRDGSRRCDAFLKLSSTSYLHIPKRKKDEL